MYAVAVGPVPLTWTITLRPLPADSRGEPPAARRSHDLAVLVDHLAAADGDDWPAGDLPAGEDREPPVREDVFIPDRPRDLRIPDDDVGVGANSDDALFRVHPEQLG